MALHLDHPALTTTGKKKGKHKFASAEAKRQFLALEKEWQHKQSSWLKLSKPTTTTMIKPKPQTVKEVKATGIPSLNSWVTGAVSSKPNPIYTGDNVLGVTVLHKSCLQPVFNKQSAVDAASMRR